MLLPPELWRIVIWKKRLLEAEERLKLYPPEYETSMNIRGEVAMWLYKSRSHLWVIYKDPIATKHTFLSSSVINEYFYG